MHGMASCVESANLMEVTRAILSRQTQQRYANNCLG
jgi:hypothetical protein